MQSIWNSRKQAAEVDMNHSESKILSWGPVREVGVGSSNFLTLSSPRNSRKPELVLVKGEAEEITCRSMGPSRLPPSDSPSSWISHSGRKKMVCARQTTKRRQLPLFPGRYVEFTHSERRMEGLFAGCVITHSDCILDFQYQGLI